MAQEVLLRFLRQLKLPTRQPIKSLGGFLFTIARNLSADAHKYNSRRPTLESLTRDPDSDTPPREAPSHAANPHEAAVREEQRRLVREALHSLDDDIREVLLLRHIESMSCPQIATMLGIPEGTVWSRLHRGLETLRHRLNPADIARETKPTERKQP